MVLDEDASGEATMKISIRWALILGCLGLIWIMQIIITSSSYISSQRVLAGHASDIMQNIADLTITQSENHLQLADQALDRLQGGGQRQ